MRYVMILLLVSVLVSCAHRTMKQGLPNLVGEDIETAFQVLGYPSGKQQFGDQTVYVWAIDRQQTTVVPQTSTTTGMVGDTPVYGQTTSYQAVPMNAQCTIKLAAGPSGTIQNWEYQGNAAGCRPYANRLYEEYLKSEHTWDDDK